jgi:hypothetical protein
MLLLDSMILAGGHFDKKEADQQAWHYPAAICSKLNYDPTSKNAFDRFKAGL